MIEIDALTTVRDALDDLQADLTERERGALAEVEWSIARRLDRDAEEEFYGNWSLVLNA